MAAAGKVANNRVKKGPNRCSIWRLGGWATQAGQ